MKLFNFLTLFGEPEETDSEKLARIEKALADKDAEIAQLKATNEGLEKKINSIKLDALTKQVEPAKEEVEEPVSFDFDM